VPFFFYVVHIYVIHLIAMLVIIYTGYTWNDYVITANSFMTKSLSNFGFELYVVYLIWILVVVSLFPLCKWYNEYKAMNREMWWLRYL